MGKDTEGDGEAVAWLYTEHRWKDGPRHRLSMKRQSISPEDINEFEITEDALYKHADPDATEKMRAWDWLAENTDLELSHGCPGEDDDPSEWLVYRRGGNRSDREWTLIANAATPVAAITQARAALGEA